MNYASFTHFKMAARTGPPLFTILVLMMLVGASLGLKLDAKVTAFLERGKKMGLASASSETMDIVIEVNGAGRSGSRARNGVTVPTILSLSAEKERRTRAKAVKDEMVHWAKQSQGGIISKLKKARRAAAAARTLGHKKMTITSSWITNRVIARGATASVIDSLCHDSNMNISVIRAEVTFKINSVEDDDDDDVVASTLSSTKWHLDKIQAPYFWAHNGTTGEGILVGHIDTGVRRTHQALKHNWVKGPGGWHDPTNEYNSPHDTHDHGTHTLALAVGSKGVGVAPGAKWTSCLGCPETECRERDLIACSEFMACPTRDKNGNCSGIPHVVSNSWGTNHDNVLFYDDIIHVWRELGIIPVFAAGNSKNLQCSTLNSPCDDIEVICVGATTEDDELAELSSIGPSHRNPNDIKPDITAPGKSVYSALTGHDSHYGEKSGTSMATPIVAGGVALLLSNWKKHKESYTFDKVRDWITNHSRKNDLQLETDEHLHCHGRTYSQIPNDFFGYGRFSLTNGADPKTTFSFSKRHVLTITIIILVSILF